MVKEDQRFFSEFETYGTFIDNAHPGFYAHRRLRTLRHGTDFLGANPSSAALEWASRDFDTISFERWGKSIPELQAKAENPLHREKMTFADTIRAFFKAEKKKIFAKFPHINNEQFQSFFENTVSKTNFDFFFSPRVAFSTRHEIFEDELLQRCRFLYVTKCRIHRYWRLFTLHF